MWVRSHRNPAARLLLLLCAGGRLSGQPDAAQIQGVIVDAASGSPLRKAYVSLTTVEDNPAEALAITDDSGRFGFANIPPGRYKLHAECDGYQPAWYGAPTPHHAPGVMTLHAGENRQDLALRLMMLGAISGVVLDQEGDPVDRASVSLWVPWFRRGRPGYAQRTTTSTNDRGEYRFPEVNAGRYLVMANAQGRGRPRMRIQPEVSASTQPIDQTTQFQFGFQYFPSVERLAEASLVTVVAGREVEGVDFHLVAHPATMLHGTVIPPGDLPADTPIQIGGSPLDTPEPAQQMFGAGATPPNYEFSMGGILPGEYQLVATVSNGDKAYRGVQRFLVNAGLENHVTLKLDPGIDLAGSVKIEGQKMEAGMRVGLSSGDTIRYNGSTPQAPVKADGTFVIPGVVPGIWDIVVQPIPDGGYIKSMRLGRQDVLTEEMVIGSDTKDHLDIVVSTHGGILEGDVTTESGESTAPSHVLLAPDGQYSNVLSFYGTAIADEKGHFKLKHLTPGRYKLYSFNVLDYCAWCNPDFLKPFANQGQPVEIVEGMNHSREIGLIHNIGKQP